MAIAGCGNDKHCDEVDIIYPQGGSVFYTDAYMFVQFTGPTDKTYHISFVLAPNKNTPIKYDWGTTYDDRLGGYRLGGILRYSPTSPYSVDIPIPWDIPAGRYRLKIIFTDKDDFWKLDPILFYQESDEFEIRQGKG